MWSYDTGGGGQGLTTRADRDYPTLKGWIRFTPPRASANNRRSCSMASSDPPGVSTQPTTPAGLPPKTATLSASEAASRMSCVTRTQVAECASMTPRIHT